MAGGNDETRMTNDDAEGAFRMRKFAEAYG
jgi:hypothetical protein